MSDTTNTGTIAEALALLPISRRSTQSGARRVASPMITISAGLLDPKHIGVMGPALAEFLCLIDWQTDASGLVKGGAPIKIDDIAQRLGRSRRTAQRNLERLERYVDVTRTPYGLVIRIRNPKKWFQHAKNCTSGDVKSGTSGVTDLAHPIKTNTEGRIQGRGSGAEKPPPAFRCSHGDCSHSAYHSGRIVAEAQGLNFPDDVGSLPRWLKESEALTKYADNDITEFVEFKIKRESPKWDSRPLRPAYVAEDITVYLRKHESDVGTKPNGHDQTGFWISDRERDRRRQASKEGQTT